jgi:hypothetical protein
MNPAKMDKAQMDQNIYRDQQISAARNEKRFIRILVVVGNARTQKNYSDNIIVRRQINSWKTKVTIVWAAAYTLYGPIGSKKPSTWKERMPTNRTKHALNLKPRTLKHFSPTRYMWTTQSRFII